MSDGMESLFAVPEIGFMMNMIFFFAIVGKYMFSELQIY